MNLLNIDNQITEIQNGTRDLLNWKIDEAQECQLQEWAEAKGVWVDGAEEMLTAKYGPIMAQGAEAKVSSHFSPS